MINHSTAYELAEKYPGRIAVMGGPTRMRPPKGLPLALDNDRFSSWSKGKEWSEELFLKMLDNIQSDWDLLWVVVPDIVADADATFQEWEKWAPKLRDRGLKLALAAQDGMTPRSVNRHTDPDVLFLGGTLKWKRSTQWNWCQHFDRVHVGRVNTERGLWHVQSCGGESSDGTGWFRGDQKQKAGLMNYLEVSSGGGQLQAEFSFSRTFDGGYQER